MKKKTIETNKRIKSKLVIALAALSILGVGAIVATQAKRNVLDGTTPYTKKDEFRVLEIVPTNENDANEEIGYFVSDEKGKADFKDVSKAKSLGGRSNTDVGSAVYNQELQNFLKLREYGLVKYEGIDRGIYNVDVSEHPIYSAQANFVKRATAGYRMLEDQLVLGKYQKTAVANGRYFLKEGYSVSGNGLIYKEVEKTISVSSNDINGNTVVSENTIRVQEPIPAGDPNNKQIPEALEQRYTEDGELDVTGDVNFIQDETGVYYGLTNDVFYVYEKPDQENNAFYNGDWFKEYVLGDRASTQKVVVDTISAKSVDLEMIGSVGAENYDLIYISGTYDAYVTSESDLTEAVVMQLYNMATLPDYQAIMMDYKLLSTNASSNPSNIEKLALMLWQKNQRAILSVNAGENGFVVENDLVIGLPKTKSETETETGEITTTSTWSVLGSKMTETPGFNTGNFVAGSVYVYDHKREHFDNSKVQVDAADFFANGDFASSYTAKVIAGGFVPVKVAVQMNNINHVDKKVPEAITPAVIIQYILAYDGTNPSLVKTELRILEIQPVRAFLYNSYWGTTAYVDCTSEIQTKRKEFINNFLDQKFIDNPTLVSFTSMTIEEFIGRNADINEEYDLIYIGSEISHTINATADNRTYNEKTITYYNTTSGKSNKIVRGDAKKVYLEADEQATLTQFNDNANMCGMVYYNVGDTLYVGTLDRNTLDSLLGIIDDDTEYKKEGESKARFSGRDLTQDKLNAMKEYLDAGYPVVVAEDIVSSVSSSKDLDTLTKTINPTKYNAKEGVYDHGRVDNCSKLYEFLDYAVNGQVIGEGDNQIFVGGKENLISEGDVKSGLVDKSVISEYLNKPKLSVNLTSRPVEYSYSTSDVNVSYSDGVAKEAVINNQTQLSPDAAGKYNLDYEFTITNAGALGEENDTYNVHLYIDVNADGKFSEQEELKDCTVTNAVTGMEVQARSSIDGKSYALQADVLYKLHRQVPEGYNGILPWSLEIVMEKNHLVRASECGYTLVPRATTEKIPISILQINNSSSTLNLQNQLAKPTESNHYFGLYLKQLNDYNVTVTTVDQKDFQKEDHANGYLTAKNYDMLILGFGDCYDAFDKKPAIQAIIDFIEAGKPVLLTHDLVMFRAGATQTKMLRNYVGMDRYGCYDYSVKSDAGAFVLRTATIYTRSADRNIVELIEEAGHRVAYVPGKGKESIDWTTQGISNLTMVRYRQATRDTTKPDKNVYFENEKNKYYYIAGHEGISSLIVGDWKDQQEYMVHNINEGQLTTYPYILPEKFNVAPTHNQYYQLDMEGDMDEDGETDIVVWYTLGNRYMGSAEADPGFTGNGSEYTFTPNDVVNGYYIYNKGNVTYSGVGHKPPASNAGQKYEAQLFVNTMIAAYRAGTRAPQVKFYDSEREDATEITSLPVVYDENVGWKADTNDTSLAESSVLKLEDGNFKNAFVDDDLEDGDNVIKSTKLYFEFKDDNLVRGTKGIKLNFYLENPEGDKEIVVDGQKIKVSGIKLDVYNSDFTKSYEKHALLSEEVADPTVDEDCMLQPATRYGIKLPLSKLKDQGELKLYVEAETTVYNKTVSNKTVTDKSPKTVASFSVIKMDLLNLD